MLIKLRVHPDVKAASLTKKSEDTFEISVRAPAEDGRANRESLALLAKALGVEHVGIIARRRSLEEDVLVSGVEWTRRASQSP